MEKGSFVQEFEIMLRNQLANLVNLPTDKSRESLESSLLKCISLFKLDRISLYPLNMLNMRTEEYVTATRETDTAVISTALFSKNDAKEYFEFVSRVKKTKTLSKECLQNHKLKIYKHIAEEGFRCHIIIPVSVHGKQWGALCASILDTNNSDFALGQLERLKSLAELWVLAWRYSVLEHNLVIPSDIPVTGSTYYTLTKRQTTVLSKLASGLTAKECAEKLGISKRTVETHKYKIMEVIGVKNHTELVQYAIRNNLVA